MYMYELEHYFDLSLYQKITLVYYTIFTSFALKTSCSENSKTNVLHFSNELIAQYLGLFNDKQFFSQYGLC